MKALTKEYPPLKINTPRAQADKWFAKGVEKHDAFDRGLKQVRRDGIEAAFAFLRARAAFQHGEWQDYVALHSKRISLRTVQFYIQLAERAREWVFDANPNLKTVDEVNRAALELVLQSPKPLIALARELGHMRKFGEYDAVKYAQKKLGNGADQVEFDFAKLLTPLDALTHFGEDGYEFIYPEGVEGDQFIGEVERKLETALARVREFKKNGRVIEA